MDRGLKVFLAVAIVSTGLVAAWLSRPPTQPLGPPVADWVVEPWAPPPPVEREREGPELPPARIGAATPGLGDDGPLAPGGQRPWRAPADSPPWLSPSYPPETPLPAAPAFHVIVDGDTLAGLASRYLGDANRWPELWEANRDLLADPAALPIGAKLRLPGPAESSSAGSDATGDLPLVPLIPPEEDSRPVAKQSLR